MNDIILKTAIEAAQEGSGVRVHEQAYLPVTSIVFSPELLKYCEANACGFFNRSWTCPPAAESLEKQREKILSYKTAFVFTTKHDLEDSFDIEAMDRGKEMHTRLLLEFRSRVAEHQHNKTDTPLVSFILYGAGSCPVCKDQNGKTICSYPKPCPFPDKKIGSIEAAGINVTELSKAAGIAYNNGPNTVTYFSMMIYNDCS